MVLIVYPYQSKSRTMNTTLPRGCQNHQTLSLPLILFCFFYHSLCLTLTTTHLSPFSLLATQYISCGGLIVPNPGGMAHFADTAADVLYSSVISVRPTPYNCQARGKETWNVCTLKYWSRLQSEL